MPGFSRPFYTMEARPVCKDAPPMSEWLQVSSENFESGERTIWYNDGAVLIIKGDGTTKEWYARPTIKDVVLMPPHASAYTEFKSTGEIVQLMYDNIYWYWGAQNIETATLLKTDIVYIDDDYNDCGCGGDYGYYSCCGKDNYR